MTGSIQTLLSTPPLVQVPPFCFPPICCLMTLFPRRRWAWYMTSRVSPEKARSRSLLMTSRLNKSNETVKSLRHAPYNVTSQIKEASCITNNIKNCWNYESGSQLLRYVKIINLIWNAKLVMTAGVWRLVKSCHDGGDIETVGKYGHKSAFCTRKFWETAGKL